MTDLIAGNGPMKTAFQIVAPSRRAGMRHASVAPPGRRTRARPLARAAAGLLVALAALLAVLPAQAQDNAQSATYRVTFEGQWTTAATPGGVPISAHFSSLIGAVHNASATFWSPGGTASRGIGAVAETGSNRIFKEEINANSNAVAVVERTPSFGATDTVTADFEVTRDHPLITLVTMIAPSPDWFVGVHGESLLDAGGQWRTSHSVDLFPYDAGTEEGAEFETRNEATSPQGTITRISGTGKFSTSPIATLTFVRRATVPAAPTNLMAFAGDRKVRLVWAAPDPGAVITGHEYRYKTDGDYPDSWTTIDDSAPGGTNQAGIIVTGLDNGEAYTFQVRAVNDDVQSQESNEATATPILPAVTIEAPARTAEDGGSILVCMVTSNPSIDLITATLTFEDGTATATEDYTGTAVTAMRLRPFQLRSCISVSVVDDEQYEGDEDFTATLSNVVNATPGTPHSVSLTIVDNDVDPAVGVAVEVVSNNAAVTALPENAGTATIRVTATTSANQAPTGNIGFTISSRSGTAMVGASADFIAVSELLEYAPADFSQVPGEQHYAATKTLTLTINDDALVEEDETFTLITQRSPHTPAYVTLPGSLTISGVGTCEITATATANYNEGSATFTVTVQAAGTPPSAPRGVYTEAGNAQLTLYWSPVDDGGADIEKFQYQQRTTGPFSTDWTDIPDSAKPDPDTPGSGANFRSYTITSGVANGTTYRYRLRAVNGWDGVSTLNMGRKFLTYFEFGEEMRGFTPSDVSVTNGSAVRVLVERASESSSTRDPNRIYASKYAVDIQPAAAGEVTVSLPAGKVFSAGGKGNSALNSLTYNYVVSTVRPQVLITEPFGCEATGNGFCVMVVFHDSARDIPVQGFEATDLTLTNGEVASLVSDESSGYSMLEDNEAVQYYAVWGAVIQPESGYTGPFTVSMAEGVVQDYSGNTNLPTASDTQYTTTVTSGSGQQQGGATRSPIAGFTLFDNANGGADVMALTEGAKLAALSSERLNIRTEAASGAKIGSVRMELTGAVSSSRTEGIAPYALFGDRGGRAFAPGSYTVTATPYPERNLGGTAGPALSVTFRIVLPVLSVADARAEEGTDETIDFAVTLDAASRGTVTVDYATSDGTATAGRDYTAASGTLTFARGETAKTVRVTVLDDAKDEGEETFTLRLSDASGATLTDAEATGCTRRRDRAPG